MSRILLTVSLWVLAVPVSAAPAIESWTDDMGMGQVVSRVINNIRHDRVSVNRQGDKILVTAVTGARP